VVVNNFLLVEMTHRNFTEDLGMLRKSLQTWGEWAIAMHGRYESLVSLVLFTHIVKKGISTSSYYT
jgi:hypothetical protein